MKKWKFFTRYVWLTFVIFQFIVVPGYGVSVPKYSLEKLVSESSVILAGTVTGIRYETEKNEEVFTRVQLQRIMPIKGEHHLSKYLKEGMTLYFSGGLAEDGLMNVVVGVPQLQLAGTYLLFLRGGKWTLNPITGWNQGAFNVVSTGVEDKFLLVNMDNQILMGVQKGNLVFATAKKEPCEPCKEKKKQGAVEIDKEPDYSRLPKEKEESIYREDNVEELEKQDQERVKELEKEKGVDKVKYKQKLIKEMLGGEPMYLHEFISLVKEIDKKTQEKIPEALKEFYLKPELLPKELKSAPPPQKVEKNQQKAKTTQ